MLLLASAIMILVRNIKIIIITLTLEDPRWFRHLKLIFEFLIHICFIVANIKQYLSRGYSRHRNGDKYVFSYLSAKISAFVTYGDNNKTRIIRFGITGTFDNLMIRDVILVVGLKCIFLCISRLCDKGNIVTFDLSGCKILKSQTNQNSLY